MPLLKEDIYTIDDIMNLPEGQRAELIDGKIYDMAPPSPLHQEIAGELFAAIHSYLKSKHGPCKPHLAPIGVFLSADENTNFVEPDLLVVCDPSKITKRGCEGAPDFIIEVVSPGSRRMDYNKKNALYSDSGVREYWIVDPAKERITVYHYEVDAAPAIFTFDQNVTVGIYGDLQICLNELLNQ